jgi:hypothetical protein
VDVAGKVNVDDQYTNSVGDLSLQRSIGSLSDGLKQQIDDFSCRPCGRLRLGRTALGHAHASFENFCVDWSDVSEVHCAKSRFLLEEGCSESSRLIYRPGGHSFVPVLRSAVSVTIRLGLATFVYQRS